MQEPNGISACRHACRGDRARLNAREGLGALRAGQAGKIVISSNHVSFENASIIFIKLKTI